MWGSSANVVVAIWIISVLFNFLAEAKVFTHPWGLQLLRHRMEKLVCKMWLTLLSIQQSQ